MRPYSGLCINSGGRWIHQGRLLRLLPQSKRVKPCKRPHRNGNGRRRRRCSYLFSWETITATATSCWCHRLGEDKRSGIFRLRRRLLHHYLHLLLLHFFSLVLVECHFKQSDILRVLLNVSAPPSPLWVGLFFLSFLPISISFSFLFFISFFPERNE